MSDFQEHSRDEAGSDRQFGLVIAGVMVIIALWPLLGAGTPRYWLIAIAVVFAALGLVAPHTLHPLNLLWHRFGILLGRVVAPVVMGIVFFVGITPIALLFKLRGKDLLERRPDTNAGSYWIVRDQPVGSMKDQF
jgi:hypothetical protein